MEVFSDLIDTLIAMIREYGVLAIIVVLGLVVSFVWTSLRQGWRDKSIGRMATALGLISENEVCLPASLLRLPVFQRARILDIRDVVAGHLAGHWLILFTLETQTGGGEHAGFPDCETVAAMRSDLGSVPCFSLQPRALGFVRRGPGARGTAAERFKRSYIVEGKDADTIRRIFSPPLIEYLAAHRGWWMEGEGEWIVLYRRRRRVSIRKFARHVGAVEDLIRFISPGIAAH